MVGGASPGRRGGGTSGVRQFHVARKQQHFQPGDRQFGKQHGDEQRRGVVVGGDWHAQHEHWHSAD
jgi:hypothetical protein